MATDMVVEDKGVPIQKLWKQRSWRPRSPSLVDLRAVLSRVLHGLRFAPRPVLLFDLCVALPSGWKWWRGVAKRRRSIVLKKQMQISSNRL